MHRLKQLRESANYSQQRLAEMLKTTQQTIGRWETGKAEPSLSALRDLALIFGTSVDHLLGLSRTDARTSTTHHHIFAGEDQDGFWGHVGLKLEEGPTKWFPVTAGAAARVRSDLNAVDGPDDWISFETLANKVVACRPWTLRKIWLLDDACDGPGGDWEQHLPYQGLPLEMYRAFDRLHEVPLAPEDWDAAAASIPGMDEAGHATGDPDTWATYLETLSTAFEDEASDAFLASVTAAFVADKLYDDDIFFRARHYTEVYFTDGTSEAFWAEPEDLSAFEFEVDLEQVPAMVRLEHFGGAAEPYYASSRLAAVIMPLLDLEEDRLNEEDDD